MLRKLLTVSCTLVSVATLTSAGASRAAAQDAPVVVPSTTPAPNGAVTPTVPQQTETTEVTPRAAPAPVRTEPPAASAPPPSALGRAAQVVGELVRIHGILRPTVTFSSHAVESFSNSNAGAVTAAGNPVLSNLPDDARLSFQVAQTRFGLWVAEKESVRAHLEFDFIDFGKASPTVQAVLRLRIAAVEWSPTERLTIAAGQDWDLFAPLNPHGVNLVGGHFQSGNTGFMRHQVKALYKLGDSLELASAIGLAGSNATSRDGPIELARMPTLALRATGLLGKLGRLGLNGIVTRLRFSPGSDDERHALAGAIGGFGELLPTETLAVRFEAYLGRNLANLGALALATGRTGKDVDEVGAWVSARQAFLEQHAVYASYGFARVLDGDDVVPSYIYPSALPGMLPALSSATLAGSGPGIRWNTALRLGYDYKPIKALALVLEGFWYKTRHVLLGIDDRAGSDTPHAFGADVAMVYTF